VGRDRPFEGAITLVRPNRSVTFHKWILWTGSFGFQAVTGSVEVEPGSTVVVQEGGAAEFVCSESSRMAVVPGYHPVPIECATVPQEQAQAFELDTAGYLLIGAGVLGGAIAIIEGTKDSDSSASA
jgi:hypothetical protein